MYAGHVHGRRFLHKHVLLALDRGQSIGGMEPRCAGNQHDIAVLNDPFVSIQTGKPPRRIDLDSIGELALKCPMLASILSAKTSAMAHSWVLGSPASALAAAPDPRPPHPINPSLMLSLPAACALRESVN